MLADTSKTGLLRSWLSIPPLITVALVTLKGNLSNTCGTEIGEKNAVTWCKPQRCGILCSSLRDA